MPRTARRETPYAGPWRRSIPRCPGCRRTGELRAVVGRLLVLHCGRCKLRWLVEEVPVVEPAGKAGQ